MRIFTYILSAIALVFIIYNLTKVDFSNPLEGDSKTAIITVIAGFCALFILAIIRVSRKIDETVRKKKRSTQTKQ